MQSVPIDFLNITILSEKFAQRLQPEQISYIEGIGKCFVTATGEMSPFLGKTVVDIQIGKQRLKQKVWIADVKNEGILGADFLERNNCDLLFSTKILRINGEKVKCFSSKACVVIKLNFQKLKTFLP